MSHLRIAFQLSVLCAVAMASASTTRAHDTWVLPQRDRVSPGETVRIALATGMEFPKSEVAAKPKRVADWIVAGPNGRTKLSGFKIEANDLTARHTLTAPGAYAIGVALKPNFILIEAGNFEAYLKEEHAEQASLQRQAVQQTNKPGREIYSKLAKTFVQVGEGGATDAVTEPLGHALEIVPLSNPLEWRVGDEVHVRVLLHGKRIQGLTVSTVREGLPPHFWVSTRTTDEEGLVPVRLPRPGLWLIRTHYIHHTPGSVFDDGTKSVPASWESFFASIAFRVPQPDAPNKP